MSNYKAIAKRSFKAKWRIYLFDKIVYSNPVKITYSDFEEYQLSDESIKKYSNEYWQELKSHEINGKRITDIEKGITEYEANHSSEIKQFESEYVKNVFPTIFYEADFEKLKEVENCHYCKITKNEIDELGQQGKLRKKNFRGWNLEIDRLEPNKEYSKENCVMSCYWCNNAKTDEFSEKEFMAIGTAIGIALRNRLKK